MQRYKDQGTTCWYEIELICNWLDFVSPTDLTFVNRQSTSCFQCFENEID